MRAIEPRQSGQLTLEGFGIGYEAFGPAQAPAVLLMPTWQGVHGRVWKMQVPYLARTFNVITFDPPGNIVFVTLDSGLSEAFINGTQPAGLIPPEETVPPGPPAAEPPAVE